MRAVNFIATSILLFLAKKTHGSVAKPTHVVYFSKYLRAGSPIQIVPQILKNPNPVHFAASLKTPAGEIHYHTEDTLEEGKSKLLTFNEQIPIGYDGTTDFELSIVGTDSVTNETIFFNTTDELVFERKSLSMFIQTDKGIYKPSQTIKFRVVVTNSDLLPHNGSVSYKLTDPDENIVLQKKNAVLVNGIAGSEFTLGRYSTHGLWKISFECEGNGQVATVTVDEYQLPKFEIEFSPDKMFVYSESEGYTGKFSAKFTFGEPVRGEASLVLETHHYSNNFFWGQRREVKSITREYKDFNGEATFDISVEEFKKEFGWDPKNDYRYVYVTVKVKDKNSLIEIEEKSHMNLVKVPFNIEVVNTPDTVKPGFYYTAYLKVTQYDGSRISEVQRQSLDLRIKYEYMYYSPKYHSSVGYLDIDVDKDGYVTFTMRANNSRFDLLQFSVESQEKYKDEYLRFWSSRPYDSPTDTYIQLSTAKRSLKPDETAVFEVLSSWNNVSYSVMMLSQGIIVKQEIYTPDSYETDDNLFKFQYEFMVTKDMAPTVTITMYFMASNGEIVADNVIIKVETVLANTVAMSTNITTNRRKTGSPVSLSVQTTPGSTIALRAIDRGVILQKEGNDITYERVLQDLNQYSRQTAFTCYYCYYYHSTGTNAKQVLEQTGVLVMTDAATFLSQKNNYFYPGIPELAVEDVMFDGEIEVVAAEAPTFNKGETVTPNVEAPKVRKNFPETWIWDETITGDTGVQTYSLILPDTTTTWEISAFAMSQSTGLGVLDPDFQIIATREFFISLTLPPTMVSGEILSMRVTVYNFLSHVVEAQLILEESEWYEIVMSQDDESVEGRIRTVTISNGDGKTEIFNIRFLKPGLATIKVTALSEIASDAIERTLLIKPQGIEKDIAQNVLIEKNSEDAFKSNTTFDINIPSFAVEGSVYGKLSVSGSVMGSSWNNLGNLLRLPSGCGEQTMLSFAPDVFISLYLKKVGLLEGEIERKSSRHIVAGYQNELRYQHEDGSFSAFGSDDKGSTWLTAFVVKSFIAARELNEDFAHEQKIDPAINFLLRTQQSDGSFKESGYVRHRAMQGGVSSQETMTAYVVIALREGNYKHNQENITTAVDKAREYLETNVNDIDEPFALTVIAYALALSGSSSVNNVMNQLEQISKVDGNFKYWSTGEEPCSSESPSGYCGYSVARASDIEMTAYVLLTLLKLESTTELMPIVRWIIKQRNGQGGFRSTQDTVMAIQALSVFAGLYSNRTTELTLHVTHSGEADSNHTISVTQDNAIVLQSVELPPLSGVVTVTTMGVGLADVQLLYKYYLPLEDRANEPFHVEVEVDEDNGLDKLLVKVCSSINKEAENPVNETGMFVIAVTLPSGYTTNDKTAASQNEQTKMIELVGDEVTGYFDELPATGEVCVTFPIDRFMKVGKVKKQPIRVFDYYKPEQMSLRMYAPAESDDLCDTLGKDFLGCPGGSSFAITQSLTAILIQIAVTTYILG